MAQAKKIGVFPAAFLEDRLTFGDWIVGPLPERLIDADVEKLIASLPKPRSQGLLPSFLYHQETGISFPPDDEVDAIVTAVGFSLCDSNDTHRGDINSAHYVVTSENGTMLSFDLSTPLFEKYRGSFWLRGRDMGYVLGDDIVEYPFGANHVLKPAGASNFLANKVFQSFWDGGNYVFGNVHVAMQWLARAQSGLPGNILTSSIVLLAIGFEALLSTPGNKSSNTARDFSRRLRDLFESTIGHEAPRTLWNHREKSIASRRMACTKLCACRRKCCENAPCQTNCTCAGFCCVPTELEHWFLCFFELRNRIVHDGGISTAEQLLYKAGPEAPDSKYVLYDQTNLGYYWVGERLLREAIKAKICAILDDAYLAEKNENEELAELIRRDPFIAT